MPWTRGGSRLWLAILPLAGCGGPSEPTSIATPPSLVGEYAGFWRGSTTMDGQPAGDVTCPCTFTVPAQIGDAFYASSQLLAPCEGILSINDGRVDLSGAVRFQFTGDRIVGGRSAGCIVTATEPFTGRVTGGTITAARSEALDCTATDGHRYIFRISVEVTRL